MIILGVVVAWVVLLTPFAVRRLRESNLDKSMLTYRKGLQIMRRQGYSVQPARLLEDETQLDNTDARPHLRVVRDDETAEGAEPHRYAAYSSVPSGLTEAAMLERPLVSMRVRRSRIFAGLVAATVLMTAVAGLAGGSLFVDAALLAGSSLVLFVALAFVSVALGYLEPASLGIRRSVTAYAPEVEYDQTAVLEDVAEPRQYAVG